MTADGFESESGGSSPSLLPHPVSYLLRFGCNPRFFAVGREIDRPQRSQPSRYPGSWFGPCALQMRPRYSFEPHFQLVVFLVWFRCLKGPPRTMQARGGHEPLGENCASEKPHSGPSPVLLATSAVSMDDGVF